jgi:hypothetical protein
MNGLGIPVAAPAAAGSANARSNITTESNNILFMACSLRDPADLKIAHKLSECVKDKECIAGKFEAADAVLWQQPHRRRHG